MVLLHIVIKFEQGFRNSVSHGIPSSIFHPWHFCLLHRLYTWAHPKFQYLIFCICGIPPIDSSAAVAAAIIMASLFFFIFFLLILYFCLHYYDDIGVFTSLSFHTNSYIVIYLFHNFSVNVLNESKSADGFWTTDIVHSIFFTNRKSINVISSSELRIPVE